MDHQFTRQESARHRVPIPQQQQAQQIPAQSIPHGAVPQYSQVPPPRQQVPIVQPQHPKPAVQQQARPAVGQYAYSQAVSSRIASANAAIAAIQSVYPPVVPAVPRNRPTMVNVGIPQLPGGDLKGAIQYDHTAGSEVVNEKTAQLSASEFTSFLSNVRKQRLESWDSFWQHRLELNREILLNENECFKSAQNDANEMEDSDDEDHVRRGRPITVPYIYTNVGSFDIPLPKPVLMPDPELVMRTTVQQQAQQQQAQQQAQHQAQQAQHQAQQAQQAQQHAAQNAAVQAQQQALAAQHMHMQQMRQRNQNQRR